MRDINKIIVHCSYTSPSQDIGAAEIRDWHVNDNGWSDIGYHFVINRKGIVELGRPVKFAGAHVRGHNQDSIGICLVGGKKEGSNEDETNFTWRQYEALMDLVFELQLQYGEEVTVHGHNEFTNDKTCPTFYLDK